MNMPTGWAITTLGEIASEAVEQQSPDGTSFTYVDISSIDKEKKRIVSPQQLETSAAPSRAKQRLHADDVLVSMTRPNLNAVARVLEELHGSTGSTGFCVLRSAYVNPRWLEYRVQSHDFIEAMSSLVQGALYPAVRPRDVFGFKTLLPPRGEQERIAEEIEKQFTRLDDAVAALKRVQANLKRYRASVLKAACEGRLVPTEAELARKEGRDYEPGSELLKRVLAERRAKWEADQLQRMISHGKPPKNNEWKQRYNEPQRPDTSTLPELPEGWTWATIDEISECLDGKRVPVNKDERAQRKGDIPYYGANGRVGWIDEFLFDEPLVLVVEDETFVRRTIPFSYLITGKSWVNNHAHVLRPSAAVLPEYLNYSLMFYPFTPLTTGSTGRRKLTQKALMAAPYPLPPKEEQIRIVFAVERLTSMVDNVISISFVGHQRAAALRQTVLSAAFSGKLVPQDPNDEPASVLLEHIRAERARAEEQKQKTPKATNGASSTNGQRRKPGPPARATVARDAVGRRVKDQGRVSTLPERSETKGVSPGKG